MAAWKKKKEKREKRKREKTEQLEELIYEERLNEWYSLSVKCPAAMLMTSSI